MFLKKINIKSPSVLSLIGANVLFFFLVVYYEMTLFDTLVTFWGETLVIALFNFFKMWKVNKIPKLDKAVMGGEQVTAEMLAQAGGFMLGIAKYFVILWSTIFLAGFCFMTLVLIVAVFGDDTVREAKEFPVTEFVPFLLGIGIVFISHAISYYVNFIGKKEYENKKIRQFIFAPFQRIFLVWLVIIAGALILMVLDNQSVYLLIPFFLLKLLIDLRQHVKERQRQQEQTA